MRELIEQKDFGNVVYQRSVFVDQDGFVIRTTEWIPVTNSYVGGICGFNNGGIIR